MLKKTLSIFLLSTSLLAQSTVTNTPNINLQIPPYGSTAWQVPFDYNFYQLDLFLSGQLALPALLVTGQASFNQLTTWNSLQTYPSGAIVFYYGQLYVSNAAGNTGNLPTNTAYWTAGIGGSNTVIPATSLVLKGTGTYGVSGAASPEVDYLKPSTESVSYTATPTFAVTTLSSHIVFTGSITTFTLPPGTDGQFKCLDFVHDSSTNNYSVSPPANVTGFFSVGNASSKRNQQCYIYFQTDALWEATSPGVINQ